MGTWAFIDSLRSCEGTYHLTKSNSCCMLEKVGVNAIAITLDLGIQNLLILKKERCKSVFGAVFGKERAFAFFGF